MKCLSCSADAIEGMSRCQKCREKGNANTKRYNEKHRKEQCAKAKEYNKIHRGEILIKNKIRYDKNRAAILAKAKSNYPNKKEYYKDRYINNKEHHNTLCKIYRETHKTETAERMKKWGVVYRISNKPMIAERMKKWLSENVEYDKHRHRIYRQTNPDKVNKWHQTRRARRKNAFVEHVDRGVVFERDNWVCQLCGLPVDRTATHPHPLFPTLDHIIPLSKGGTHEMSNTQCTHFRCNNIKNNRSIGRTIEEEKMIQSLFRPTEFIGDAR